LSGCHGAGKALLTSQLVAAGKLQQTRQQIFDLPTGRIKLTNWRVKSCAPSSI
jgi:hypothetical protein